MDDTQTNMTEEERTQLATLLAKQEAEKRRKLGEAEAARAAFLALPEFDVLAEKVIEVRNLMTTDSAIDHMYQMMRRLKPDLPFWPPA